MTKYIKCDSCDKPIYFGDIAYEPRGRCGKYCSPYCYAIEYAGRVVMNEKVAGNSLCEVFEVEKDERN